MGLERYSALRSVGTVLHKSILLYGLRSPSFLQDLEKSCYTLSLNLGKIGLVIHSTA